jgi:hypothetical protein
MYYVLKKYKPGGHGCRPAGARFACDGIGYKYAAPLGLLELAKLNDIQREG